MHVYETARLSLSLLLLHHGLSRASPHEVRSLRFPLDALVNVGVRLARRVNSGDGSISNNSSSSNGSTTSNGNRTARRQWTRRAASRVYTRASSPSLSLLAHGALRRARAKNPARVDSPNRNGTGTVRPPCHRRSRILLPSPEVSLSISFSVPSSLRPSLSPRRSGAISLSLSRSRSLSRSLLSMYGK